MITQLEHLPAVPGRRRQLWFAAACALVAAACSNTDAAVLPPPTTAVAALVENQATVYPHVQQQAFDKVTDAMHHSADSVAQAAHRAADSVANIAHKTADSLAAGRPGNDPTVIAARTASDSINKAVHQSADSLDKAVHQTADSLTKIYQQAADSTKRVADMWSHCVLPDSLVLNVTPNGGTMAANGNSIVFPKNSVSQTVHIVMIPLLNQTIAVRFLPEGLHFNPDAPPTLTLNTDCIGNPPSAHIIYTSDDGSYTLEYILTKGHDQHSVWANIAHFSRYAVSW